MTELTLRCEVVYLRALLAVAARNHLDEPAATQRCADRLAAAESDLAALPASASAMAQLAARLALTPLQLAFFWAAVACSNDGRSTVHVEALGGPAARHGVTVGVFAALTETDPERLLELARWLARHDNPLVRLGFLVAGEVTGMPASRPYRVPPRVLSHLSGEPDGEPAVVRVALPARLLHDDPQRRIVEELRRLLATAQPDLVVVIEGPEGSGRRTALATASQRPVVALDASRVARDQLPGALVSLAREAFLAGGLPVISDLAGVVTEEPSRVDAGPDLDVLDGPVLVTTSTPGLALTTARPVVRLRWPVAEPAVRRQLWELHGAPPGGELDLLAHRYRVGPGVIGRAAASARAIAREALSVEDLAAGLRHNIAERLGGLAERVTVTQRWDDLVVADDTRDQIHALIARVEHAPVVLDGWGFRAKMARGTGVAALFSGPPGTGKSMTAGLIAAKLDLEVYQVDLSKAVSKWIGETEKNLSRIFDAAEQGHALLLFDEADALFGQRSTEMKGAVDRYANLEVNYLLQRVEAFGGITILTTNLDKAIDPALRRRLAAHIVFDLPDDDERAALWTRMLSTGSAPVSPDVDAEELAQKYPNMSGANIRNAAIGAAFLAAAEGASRIAMDHARRAARVEYRAMGHMLADRAGTRHA
jgi:hypothetical protein